MDDPGPILEIRMQQNNYDCQLCGAYVEGPGGWCLLLRGVGGGILVCRECHDRHPGGEVDP